MPSQKPTTFVFDIHGVLLRGGSARLFKKFIAEKAQEDERIDANWDGDVPLLMNGLLFKFCPVCDFKQCTAVPITGTPHLKQELFSGKISYGQMKVGITQMLTHHVECPPKMRVVLDYLAEFITQPDKLTRDVMPIKQGVALLRHIHARYGTKSLFILSNAPTQMYEMYEDRFPEIFSLVPREQVILSSEVGHCKPHKDIFQTVALKHNRLPAECLFFDDILENVQAARDEGLQAVVFSTSLNEQLQKVYRELGFTEKQV